MFQFCYPSQQIGPQMDGHIVLFPLHAKAHTGSQYSCNGLERLYHRLIARTSRSLPKTCLQRTITTLCENTIMIALSHASFLPFWFSAIPRFELDANCSYRSKGKWTKAHTTKGGRHSCLLTTNFPWHAVRIRLWIKCPLQEISMPFAHLCNQTETSWNDVQGNISA